MDSLIHRLSATTDPAEELELLHQLAGEGQAISLDTSNHFAQRGITLALHLDSLARAHELMIMRGVNLSNAFRLDSAMVQYQRAEALARSLRNPKLTALTLLRSEWVYSQQDQLDSSLQVTLRALRIGERHQLPAIVARANTSLGLIFYKSGDFVAMKKASQRAVDHYQSSRDTAENIVGLQYLALAESELEEHAAAERHQLRAVELTEQFYRSQAVYVAAGYEKLARIYTAAAQYDKAWTYYQAAWDKAGEAPAQLRDYVRNSVSSNMAEAALQTGRNEAAVTYARAAVELYVQNEQYSQLALIYRTLAEAYSNLERYDSAYHYADLRIAQLVKLFDDNSAARQLELLAEYETERRDARIRELELIESRNRLLRYGGIGTIVLLGTLLAFLFYSYRNNRRKNQLLATKNLENETLLKEIHHRVKNNLEVVSSLLELQTAELTDQNAVEAMRAGQSRVASMGLLHQRLYQGSELAVVDMPEYLRQLAESLRDTYPMEHVTVSVSADDVAFDVDTAVPIGLIVNELVTNSVKYAFESARAGRVDIELHGDVTQGYTLAVSDNGTGAVDTDAGPAGTGFGTRLVQLLTRQLGGQLTEQRAGGWRTEVRFGTGIA